MNLGSLVAVSFSALRIAPRFCVCVLAVASSVPCFGSSGQRCAHSLRVSASFDDALDVSALSESSVSRRFQRCTDVPHTSRQTSALWPRKCESSFFQRRVRHRADAEIIIDNEIIANYLQKLHTPACSPRPWLEPYVCIEDRSHGGLFFCIPYVEIQYAPVCMNSFFTQ